MRTCYQIHSHRSPEQLYRLVDAILGSSRDALVVVSHARSGPPIDRARLTSAGEVLLLEADGGYGDWSHLRRYLEVAEHLDQQGLTYDWMVNLSGQDYPVRPLREAEDELAASDADGFMEHFDVLSEASPWGVARGRTRYWYHYRRLRPLTEAGQARWRPLQAVNRLQPLVRVQVAYGFALGHRVTGPFGTSLVCYGGSFLMSLRRPCVEEVRRFVRDRPDVVRHYQRTLSPDESFLQTVLVNSGRFMLANDCKRYFDFTSTRMNHPRTLGASDVEPARRSGAHFARKWDLSRDPCAFETLDGLVGASESGTP